MADSGGREAARARWRRAPVTALAVSITLIGVAWAAELQRAIGLDLYNEQYLAAMLGLALALAFLHFPLRGGVPRASLPWYDVAAAAVAAGASAYLALRYPALVDLILLRPADGVAVSAVLILLTLEAMRRGVGLAITVIVAAFLAYGLAGHLLPGELAARPNDWQRLSAYLAIDVNGMLGAPLQAVATIIIAFILFGNLLGATGGSQFFTELALVSMGRFRGGPAKIAVVASSLFGSISGSAVANVVATGVVTIPLIKKSGYPAYKAGAIEAAASTGGQMMPPVMGAAAFLIAEFLQIPYAEVVLAALVPSLLYYAALFIQADLEAARAGMKAVAAADLPKARGLASGWFFLLPFAVLLVALFRYNLEPQVAALWSSAVLLAAAFALGYRGRRPSAPMLFDALLQTGIAVAEIVLVCAGAGFVIGVLSISGLGFNLTLSLVALGEGNLLLLLLLAAVVCIVLGMGLPTVGVYVLLAALVAPALVKLGINPLAAHLYVMYFGMMSMITPPVAVAAFAAAGLAKADPMRTGWEAVRFAWTAYIVPILFVFSPTLLLIGDTASIALAVATAVLGVWLVSIGMVGYLFRPHGAAERVLFAAAGLAALIPANAFPGAIYTDIAGAALGAALIGREIVLARRRRAPAPDRSAAPVAEETR